MKTPTEAELIADAIRSAFISAEVSNANWDPANVVDVMAKVGLQLSELNENVQRVAIAMEQLIAMKEAGL